MDRRRFLKVLGSSAAFAALAQPVARVLAQSTPAETEYFLFVHAQGGWDVLLWSDPRTPDDEAQRDSLVDLPDNTYCRTGELLMTRWNNQPLWNTAAGPGGRLVPSITELRTSNGTLRLGPGAAPLFPFADLLCLFNGLNTNTVSHPDGTYLASTGRHLAGGRPVAPSIDAVVASERLGGALFPAISINFPSAFMGNLDPRAMPLRVGSIGTISRVLTRSSAYDPAVPAGADNIRNRVTAMLSQEAQDLAGQSYYPDAYRAMAQQFQALPQMTNSAIQHIFDANALGGGTGHAAVNSYGPQLWANPDAAWDSTLPSIIRAYKSPTTEAGAIGAASAIEAFRSDKARCVSLVLGGVDTHNTNYQDHALFQQELFNVLAGVLRVLSTADHPNLRGEKLLAHTHLLVVSEFCRTPQINIAGGRDHYPSGSALLISPRVKGGVTFGATDRAQLLPDDAGLNGGAPYAFAGGPRAVAPPDVLATLLAAVGIDPAPYLRDGEVLRPLLRA